MKKYKADIIFVFVLLIIVILSTARNFSSPKVFVSKIDPTDRTIELLGHKYGPFTNEYDSSTDVYSIFYPRETKSENSEEDLILNFYFGDTGKSPALLAKEIANRLVASDLNIENRFETVGTPDKEPIFFIMASDLIPKDNFGYAYLIKISSNKEYAYSVTLAKKILGGENDFRNNTLLWMANDPQLDINVGRIEPSNDWKKYLLKK